MDFHGFTEKNADFVERWNAYRLAPGAPVASDPRSIALIPDWVNDFNPTSAERERFALALIQINAEAFVLLEQLLIVAVRKKRTAATGDAKLAFRKLVREEVHHIRGFRKFLAENPCLGYPDQGFFLKRMKWVRAFAYRVMVRTPESICMPAAKSESFTVLYAGFVRDHYGGWDANAWTRLHRIHAQDEALHIPLQFLEFAQALDHASIIQKFRLWWGVVSFFMALQFFSANAIFQMAKLSFPARGFIFHLRFAKRLARWILREFAPYGDARVRIKRMFREEKGIPFLRLIPFIYW